MDYATDSDDRDSADGSDEYDSGDEDHSDTEELEDTNGFDGEAGVAVAPAADEPGIAELIEDRKSRREQQKSMGERPLRKSKANKERLIVGMDIGPRKSRSDSGHRKSRSRKSVVGPVTRRQHDAKEE